MRDPDIHTMQGHGPMPWHKWWWRPRNEPRAVLSTATMEGNRYYFLYNRVRVAHPCIRNTRPAATGATPGGGCQRGAGQQAANVVQANRQLAG